MAGATHHLDARRYGSLREALGDADRVLADLLDAIDGQLVVPADRVDFLARRARALVRGCAAAVPEDLA